MIGRRVRASEFNEPWFLSRVTELNIKGSGFWNFEEDRHYLHRKVWEFCAIAQVYVDRINSGGRAIGFGVGREPIPAWLASRGAQVLATDRPEPDIWKPDQHAKSLGELTWEGICDEETFKKNVRYLPVDMNNIPESLAGQFDFSWSASCFEHLGGIKQGLNFFCNQMKCLRPGGISVHTTEFNYLSNWKTVEAHDLVFFRRRDLESLRERLSDQGDVLLLDFDLTGGDSLADQFVDEDPYHKEPHLCLKLAGHSFTSILLIATRGY